MTRYLGVMMNDKAPVTQLLLTASFRPALGALNVLQFADLYRTFEPDFPQFAQVAPAGVMAYKPGVTPDLALSGAPRVQFSSSDGSRFLLFQEDRFSYGWHRQSSLDEDPNYPGFETILGDAEKHWSTIRAWISKTMGLEILPDVLEVVYGDAFEVHTAENEPIPLAETFTFLRSVGTKMLSFEYQWVEALPVEEGIVIVSVQGPALTVYGRPVATMSSTADFKANESWDQIRGQFGNVRGAMNEIFQRLVKQPSNTKL